MASFFPILLVAAMPLMAQHDMSNMKDMKDMKDMPGMKMGDAKSMAMDDDMSSMTMLERHVGRWNLMFHGLAFITDSQQSGPLGGDKFYSTNWFMADAAHPLGGGTFTVKTMFSLEPATITNRQYPELFQTGETAFGKPIDGGQHPHNFFMELALRYSHPLTDKSSWSLYLAPVGEPALGPVAYPHRVSAEELPQATLGHHLQDSTHISYEVITGGIRRGMFLVEASGFHGTEPGENRWTVGYGGIDSYSARLTVSPTRNWSGQFSGGYITRPEALEIGNQIRTTASVTYNRTGTRSHWASSLIWGRVHKELNGENLNSYLAESVYRFLTRNYVTGRIELVDKDELPVPGNYRIGAYTAGYTRDFSLFPRILTGVGANFTTYSLPETLHTPYGRPVAVLMFLRFKLRDY
ncbi:MAG TPA: hypothetical protein VG273_13040 [Bryobacteraceae bacterium]|nr:hypothetical protein [Bryobacteraceae bacterium]